MRETEGRNDGGAGGRRWTVSEKLAGVAAGGRFPELRSGGREFSGKTEGIREGPKTKQGNAEWQNARSPISSTNLKLLT